jgi:beta-lactamase regulating signal transducer with metallopeptidase domain/multidrug efflux pump subunit AcrA (membrane-fusion protein)
MNPWDWPAIDRIGWALVHFVWQGAVVALALAAALEALRRRSSGARYAAACIALLAMAAAPVVTACLVPVPARPAAVPEVDRIAALDSAPAAGPAAALAEGAPSPASIAPRAGGPASHPVPAPWRSRIASTIQPVLPYFVGAWLAGVALLTLWYAGGWLRLRRLVNRKAGPASERVVRIAVDLARRLGVGRAVRVLESVAVGVPTLVGWLRPAILVPASVATGFPLDQLEALLAHELMHVRRWDDLVNAAQTAVETLLFYHPAVWWVSGRVRLYREQCCDDAVVAWSGDGAPYARALAALEERHAAARLAVAATGGSLLGRIRRILGMEETTMKRSTLSVASSMVLAGFLAAALCAFLLTSNRGTADEKRRAETAVLAEAPAEGDRMGAAKSEEDQPAKSARAVRKAIAWLLVHAKDGTQDPREFIDAVRWLRDVQAAYGPAAISQMTNSLALAALATLDVQGAAAGSPTKAQVAVDLQIVALPNAGTDRPPIAYVRGMVGMDPEIDMLKTGGVARVSADAVDTIIRTWLGSRRVASFLCLAADGREVAVRSKGEGAGGPAWSVRMVPTISRDRQFVTVGLEVDAKDPGAAATPDPVAGRPLKTSWTLANREAVVLSQGLGREAAGDPKTSQAVPDTYVFFLSVEILGGESPRKGVEPAETGRDLNVVKPVETPAGIVGERLVYPERWADIQRQNPAVGPNEFKVGDQPVMTPRTAAPGPVPVRSPGDGFIDKVFAYSGDRVKAGQELARLDASEATLQFKQAEADLQIARHKLELEETLVKQRLSPENPKKLLALEVEKARLHVELIRTRIERCRVVAPVSGVINLSAIELAGGIGAPVKRGDVLFQIDAKSEKPADPGAAPAVPDPAPVTPAPKREARRGRLVPVCSPSDGLLDKGLAKAGDRVKAGQELARLDASELEFQLKQAEADFKIVEHKMNLAATRYKMGVDNDDPKVLALESEKVQAQVAMIRNRIARCRIVAPAAGVIAISEAAGRIGAPVKRGEVLFQIDAESEIPSRPGVEPAVTDPAPVDAAGRPIVVNVRLQPDGTATYEVEGNVMSRQALTNALRAAKIRVSDQAVVIRGDRGLRWDQVAVVLNFCAEAGITKVSATFELNEFGGSKAASDDVLVFPPLWPTPTPIKAGSIGEAKRVGPPAGAGAVPAKVLAVAEKARLVLAGAGQNEGVHEGAFCVIFRENAFVARGSVTKVLPDACVIQWDPQTIKGELMVGDEVSISPSPEAPKPKG